MSQPDQLYLLIHSLNPSEKRYFSLQAKNFSKDSKPTSLKLFEALNKYKTVEYNEEEFIKLNKGKIFVKNLSYEKSYLNELILKTMRHYHNDKSVVYKLLENNIDIHFLLDKGLTEQALKLINKSYQIAKENKLFIELLQIISYKQTFITKGLLNAEYETYTLDINETLSNVTEEINWYNLRLKVMNLVSDTNFIQNLNEIQTIISKIEIDYQNKSLSQTVVKIALNILQFYYAKIHDYDKLYNISIEILNDIEIEENRIYYKINSHITMISNVLLSILRLEKMSEMPIYLNKLKSLPAEAELDKINQFRLYSQYMLLYKINTNDFSNINQLATDIDDGIKKYQLQINFKTIANIHFNIILLYFLNNEYTIVQKRLAIFFKSYKNNDITSYLYTILCCVEIMTLISLDAINTADSLLRSWTRANNSKAKEEIVFKLIEGLIKDIHAVPHKLEKRIKILDECKSNIQWEQLKALVLHWVAIYKKSNLDNKLTISIN